MRNKKSESACPKVKQCLEEVQNKHSGSVWAAIRVSHAVSRAAHAIISIISSMFFISTCQLLFYFISVCPSASFRYVILNISSRMVFADIILGKYITVTGVLFRFIQMLSLY